MIKTETETEKMIKNDHMRLFDSYEIAESGYQALYGLSENSIPKVAKMVDALRQNSDALPVALANGEHLLSGTHRFAAHLILEMQIPVVQVDDEHYQYALDNASNTGELEEICQILYEKFNYPQQ